MVWKHREIPHGSALMRCVGVTNVGLCGSAEGGGQRVGSNPRPSSSVVRNSIFAPQEAVATVLCDIGVARRRHRATKNLHATDGTDRLSRTAVHRRAAEARFIACDPQEPRAADWHDAARAKRANARITMQRREDDVTAPIVTIRDAAATPRSARVIPVRRAKT